MTIREFADTQNVSRAWIYQIIKKGLPYDIVNGCMKIDFATGVAWRACHKKRIGRPRLEHRRRKNDQPYRKTIDKELEIC